MLGGLAVFFAVFVIERVGIDGIVRLAVTLGLVGMAAVVIVPSFIRTHGCGGIATACKSNLKNIGTALEMYSSDNAGSFPVSLTTLVPNYLRFIPTCPAAGYDTYSDLFETSHTLKDYTLCCAGDYHKRSGLGLDSPAYSSRDGIIEPDPSAPPAPRSARLHTVGLGDAFFWVQVLLTLVGVTLAIDPSSRLLAIGLVAFSLMPWGSIVAHYAAPADDYNACVRNLTRMRGILHRYRVTHPHGPPPRYEDLATSEPPPRCPSAATGYALGYRVDPVKGVTISCMGQAHTAVRCPPNHPSYTESDDRVSGVP